MAVFNAPQDDEKSRWSIMELIKALREFFENIRKYMEGMRESKSKNALILQKMDELEDEMIDLAANDEITQEAVEELTKVVTEMNGKIDALTPEKLNEMLDKFNKELDDIKNGDELKSPEKSAENDLLMRKAEWLVTEAGISTENFEQEFLSKAKIIDVGDRKNTLLIEMDGVLLQANFNTNEDGKSHIDLDYAKPEYAKGIFDENHNLKSPYTYVENEGCRKNAFHNLMATFASANGIAYTFNPDEERNRLIEQASPEERFLYERTKEKTVSEGGKYESKLVDGSFYVRNTETGTCLRVFTNSRNCIQINVSERTDIPSKKDSVREKEVEKWETYNLDKARSIMELNNMSPEVMDMLMCDEIQRYLEINSISKENQIKPFIDNGLATGILTEEDIKQGDGIKLYGDSLEKVKKLRDIVVNDNTFEDVSIVNAEYKTYMQIEDKDKKSYKFEFDKQGNPTKLFYTDRTNPNFGTPKQLYDFKLHISSGLFDELRKEDSLFEGNIKKLLSYAQKAFEKAEISKPQEVQKPLEQETKPSEQKQLDFAHLPKIDIPYGKRNLAPLELKYMTSMYGLDKSYKFANAVIEAAGIAFDKERLPKDVFDKHYPIVPSPSAEVAKALCELGVTDKNGKAICTPQEFTNTISELASSLEKRYDTKEIFGMLKLERPSNEREFKKWEAKHLSDNSDSVSFVENNAWKALLADAFNNNRAGMEHQSLRTEDIYESMKKDFRGGEEKKYFERENYSAFEPIKFEGRIDGYTADYAAMLNKAAVSVIDMAEQGGRKVTDKCLCKFVFMNGEAAPAERQEILSDLRNIGVIDVNGNVTMDKDDYIEQIQKIAHSSTAKDKTIIHYKDRLALLSQAYSDYSEVSRPLVKDSADKTKKSKEIKQKSEERE